MSQLLHTILVVLGLPKPVAALIIRMNAILSAMLANAKVFPNPPLALATVQTHVDALGTTEAATKTKAVGTTEARDAARKLAIEDFNQLHGYVQQLANATPDQAATIAAAAAMTLRKKGVHPVHDLTVKQTVSGTVLAVAKNVKGARAHEWQYSLDGGKSWLSAQTTAKASTSITGITPGVLVQVRHRSIMTAGPGDWSSAVTLAVS
jgi:hypothetical protein